MRQYQLKETKEITKIICNRCGKETKVVSGIPKREMLHVEHTWGYFSGKDGESCSFDLCALKSSQKSLYRFMKASEIR